MDISTEIAAIQAASQGSELRQPLVGALNKLNSGSLPAVTASDAGKILKVGANGWEVGEKSGYIPVPTATKQITENGTYDVTDYASAAVNVSGGGGTVVKGGIGPFLGFSNLINNSGVIRTNAYNSGFNILSSGHISTFFLNNPVLIICSMRNLINDPCILINGFTSIYRNTEIEIFSGILTNDTVIETSRNENIFLSIIAIDSNYIPSIYQNLCSNSGNTLVNTDYLKTAYAYGIGCALPTGYGIFICEGTYDYNDTSYDPFIWQPINNFINAPEIMLRSADNSIGGYAGTGLAIFCKCNTSAYNQYYVRGSLKNIEITGSLKSPSNFVNTSAFNVPGMRFYDVPTWNNVTLYTAYIKLDSSNS